MGWIILLVIIIIAFSLINKKNDNIKIKGDNDSSPSEYEVGVSYTTRMGKSVKTDKVFAAWTSGNLNKMLKVVIRL